MALSALRKICLLNPERGGYAVSRSKTDVLYNWRFNHGIGPRVSKRVATHMEPLAIGGGSSGVIDTPSYAYYSVGHSFEAKRCLHLLVAENYAFGTPMVFHDVVPTVDRAAYRFYLDLETSDPNVLSTCGGSLSPLSIAKTVIEGMKVVLGGGDIDKKLLEVVAFDASKQGSKFSMHLIFPNLIQERGQQAQIQARLLEALEGRCGEHGKLVASVIDRGSHSSQPKLRMPFCDKISGISAGGSTVNAHRTLEYVGEFTPEGVYRDFSTDAVESVLDLRRSLSRTERECGDSGSDGNSSDYDSSDSSDGEGGIAELRSLAERAFSWSFWLIPARALPKNARLARVTMTQYISDDIPCHPDAERIADILDRACLVPVSSPVVVASDSTFFSNSIPTRNEIFESYTKVRSSA